MEVDAASQPGSPRRRLLPKRGSDTKKWEACIFFRDTKKWEARIRQAGAPQYPLGYFSTEKEAARAFDAVARRLRGAVAHGGRPGPDSRALSVRVAPSTVRFDGTKVNLCSSVHPDMTCALLYALQAELSD